MKDPKHTPGPWRAKAALGALHDLGFALSSTHYHGEHWEEYWMKHPDGRVVDVLCAKYGRPLDVEFEIKHNTRILQKATNP